MYSFRRHHWFSTPVNLSILNIGKSISTWCILCCFCFGFFLFVVSSIASPVVGFVVFVPLIWFEIVVSMCTQTSKHARARVLVHLQLIAHHGNRCDKWLGGNRASGPSPCAHSDTRFMHPCERWTCVRVRGEERTSDVYNRLHQSIYLLWMFDEMIRECWEMEMAMRTMHNGIRAKTPGICRMSDFWSMWKRHIIWLKFLTEMESKWHQRLATVIIAIIRISIDSEQWRTKIIHQTLPATICAHSKYK